MGKSAKTINSPASVPLRWTAALFVISAAIVAGAGTLFSQRIERFPIKPPGNRADDEFRQISRRVDELERLWESALDEEASRLLASGNADGDFRVAGIVQASRLNPRISESARAHFRTDGAAPRVKPVLAKFARNDSGEWPFPDDTVASASGWVETADRPLAWRHGNGRTAIVFLLDPREAEAVAAEDLRGRIGTAESEPGAHSWEGPDGIPWLVQGKIPAARPDEILRHPSRFGDWTLRRFYPVRVVTSYRLPVLLGGFALGGLLLAGGVAVISWQRKAARLAEQRVSFVNRVSHELRTPLTNLLLNADLALDGLPVSDAKVRRRLGLIREETARLSRIVDNVQTFARIERGNGETRPAACNVAEIVAILRDTFAPLFARKSISCEFDCRVAGEVGIDPDALAQILSNLLSNVEKYAGESATARVAISAGGGELRVEVTDSGPGVPAAARKRIFLPFERAGSRVDEGATGTGLGLAISRDLAEAMGGRLVLEDAGGGAKFRLSVPLAERSRA